MRITLLVIFLSFTNFIYSPIDNEYVPRNCITSRADELPLNCYAQELEKCSPSTNTEVNHLLQKYFIDCDVVNTMWLIAQAENHGRQVGINKKNTNGTWDCGWLQNNTVHKKDTETKEQFCERMYSLEENIKLASKIYNDRKKQTGNGFQAWSTYNNNRYKNPTL